jgi:hypothetical protein
MDTFYGIMNYCFQLRNGKIVCMFKKIYELKNKKRFFNKGRVTCKYFTFVILLFIHFHLFYKYNKIQMHHSNKNYLYKIK